MAAKDKLKKQLQEQEEALTSVSDADDKPDVMSIILVIAWFVLVGGRWLATPFLMFGDPELARTVAKLDGGALLMVYLILAALTLLFLALRFVRKIESKPANLSGKGGAS